MFMDSICIVINKFYEKKRYIKYFVIKKMLKLDNSGNGSFEGKNMKNNEKKEDKKELLKESL